MPDEQVMLEQDGGHSDSLWPLLALAGLVLAVYGRAAGFGFTDWDDGAFVARSPVLSAPVEDALRSIMAPGGIPGEPLYIPLTYLSYWFEGLLFGFRQAAVPHTTNILLHLLNVLLVYELARRLSENRLGGLVTAALFAVHPLQVEPVAWIMGRKDLLSTGLSLASMLSFHAYLTRPRVRPYLWSVTAFLAACLAKPTALALPGWLALLAISRRRRLTRRAVFELLPFAVLAGLVYQCNSMAASAGAGGGGPTVRIWFLPSLLLGWLKRLLLLSPPQAVYLADLELSPDRLTWTGYLVAVALFVVVAWALWRRMHVLWIIATAVAMGFLPALRIALWPVRDFVTGDRYGYVALLPAFFLVGYGCARAQQRHRRLCLAGVSIALLLCAWRGSQRVKAWRDGTSLWTAELRTTPANWLASLKLAMAYQAEGRIPAARQRYRETLALRSNYAEAHNNFGAMLAAEGEAAAARGHYDRALHLRPNYARAWYNRAVLCRQKGRLEDALVDARQAVALDPGFADAYYNLATILEDLGQLSAAEDAYRQCIQLTPRNPDAHYALGLICGRRGDHRAAAAAFARTVELAPNHAFAYHNLGIALAAGGDYQGAVSAHQRALAAVSVPRPDFLMSLAGAEAAAGHLDRAIAAARQAVRRAPGQAGYHRRLAALLGAAGEDAEAAEHRERAARLERTEEGQP